MKKTTSKELAAKLKISESRALEAVIKADLIAAVVKTAKKKGLTHEVLAERSGLPFEQIQRAANLLVNYDLLAAE